MNPEQLEKGFKLSNEIRDLGKEAIAFCKEEGGGIASLLIMMAVDELSKTIHGILMDFVRKDVKEKPELFERFRAEYGNEEKFDDFLKELEKPAAEIEPAAADVDFKPIE